MAYLFYRLELYGGADTKAITAPFHVRLAALFLDTRVSFPKRFWTPMVRVEEDGSVRISLSPSLISYLVEEKRNNGRKGVMDHTRSWRSPG